MNEGLALIGVSRVVDGELHLADVALSLAPGSMTVLLGRTRAGKTSLLRLLAGLDRPTTGSLRWNGRDVTRADVRTRDVAMVYQQFVNYPSLTVYENIASPLRLQKTLSRAEIDRRVRETAALLRIEPYLDRLPAALSGGQQQRTAIARALAKQAGLLLLDEPLANLDYKLREELRSELRALFRARAAVVVYATAEPAEALLLGGTTVVLDEGRILQRGPALSVHRAPVNVRVGQVTSDPQMSLLEAEVAADGSVQLAGGLSLRLPVAPPPGRVQLGVRAHHVRLSAGSARDVRIPALVEAQEISGSETVVYARAGSLALTALLPGAQRHALGESIAMFVDPARFLVFDGAGHLIGSEAQHGAD